MATLPFVSEFSASKTVKHMLYTQTLLNQTHKLWHHPSYFEHGNLIYLMVATDSEDDIRLAQVAVLGADTANELFPNMSP